MVYTDHKLLTRILLESSDRYTLSQVQQLDIISQFTLDIQHVKGAQNWPADALSCLGANALAADVSTMVDFVEMAAVQTDDPDLHWLRSLLSLIFRNMPLPMADGTIVCDISTGTPRLYIPASYRSTVFDCLHSLSHPGIQATQHLVTA